MRNMDEIARRIVCIKLLVDKGMGIYHTEKKTLSRKQLARRNKKTKLMLKDKTIMNYLGYYERIIFENEERQGIFSRAKTLAAIEEKAFPILYEVLFAVRPFAPSFPFFPFLHMNYSM